MAAIFRLSGKKIYRRKIRTVWYINLTVCAAVVDEKLCFSPRERMVIMAEEFFTFKGLPLVRKGNEIYYGHMADEFVTKITVLSTHKVKDIDVADKVKVQLLPTPKHMSTMDPTKLKACEKEGLYDALDIASEWLSRNNT